MKKIIYIDMDNVLVDFQSGIDKLDSTTKNKYNDKLDEVSGVFSQMDPMHGAIEAVKILANHYDLYILSTAPWKNPSAWTDKLIWIQQHFGKEKDSIFYKRLIISHHKNLNMGHYLIDDREKNGAEHFTGEWIHFGSQHFPNWQTVLSYLLPQEQPNNT